MANDFTLPPSIPGGDSHKLPDKDGQSKIAKEAQAKKTAMAANILGQGTSDVSKAVAPKRPLPPMPPEKQQSSLPTNNLAASIKNTPPRPPRGTPVEQSKTPPPRPERQTPVQNKPTPPPRPLRGTPVEQNKTPPPRPERQTPAERSKTPPPRPERQTPVQNKPTAPPRPSEGPAALPPKLPSREGRGPLRGRPPK